MGVCRATKANGDGCKLPATGQHGYCWAHDPANREERRKVAIRGGKGKAARRVTALWDEVRDVIRGVEAGDLEPPQANSMLRGFTTLIALDRLDVERSELEIAQRRLELDEEERRELVKEIEELREVAAMNKLGGGYYGT
jgi:hypothetical protein